MVKKRSTSKKVSLPETEVWIRKEVYGQAPEEHHFILSNGKKLRDLKELTQGLELMPQEVFNHHVDEFRNDFSSWTKDIFHENSLAEELKKFHSKLETELTLQRHFNNKLDKLIKKLAKR